MKTEDSGYAFRLDGRFTAENVFRAGSTPRHWYDAAFNLLTAEARRSPHIGAAWTNLVDSNALSEQDVAAILKFRKRVKDKCNYYCADLSNVYILTSGRDLSIGLTSDVNAPDFVFDPEALRGNLERVMKVALSVLHDGNYPGPDAEFYGNIIRWQTVSFPRVHYMFTAEVNSCRLYQLTLKPVGEGDTVC